MLVPPQGLENLSANLYIQVVFLATQVALHFTPVSESLSHSFELA